MAVRRSELCFTVAEAATGRAACCPTVKCRQRQSLYQAGVSVVNPPFIKSVIVSYLFSTPAGSQSRDDMRRTPDDAL